jgi:hypothetical protein
LETTDVNNDVASLFNISKNSESWLLTASWVVNAASLIRASNEYSFVQDISMAKTDNEKTILKAINDMDFIIIDKDMLFEKIKFNMPNADSDEIELYKVIYSDGDIFQGMP